MHAKRWLGVLAGTCITVGCLTRPVEPTLPEGTRVVHLPFRQSAVDKVDILFMIDDSASMGDKQDLLKQAVPDLLTRLLAPDCISTSDPSVRARPTKQGNDLVCAAGLELEFPAVHDMHIGVVTSALGGGGAPDVCEPGAGAPTPAVGARHDDDRGHLVNRTKPQTGTTEPPVDRANPIDGSGGSFLAWLPPVTDNAGRPDPNVTKEPDESAVTADFESLVVGVGEYGCGLEAQLESWYRFLVQPDPYDTIALDGSSPAKASLVGVDKVILKQRKDFLRPDSLVAVIMLTDEEDSWSDPLALGGRGWTTRTTKFPGSPFAGTMPLPTSECTDPTNPSCTSCGFTGNKANGTAISADANCQKSCGASCAGYYTPAEDGLNVRYTDDMKRRYGVDPQFPVQRYVDGLSSLKVPNRDGEHPGGAGVYKGTKNCTNPLFAKDLPDGTNVDPQALCNLAPGPRTSDLVFFAVIGGVPWQLLVDDQSAFKAKLGDADWAKVLGKDPAGFDRTGIDPHMIESVTPRAGLAGPTSGNTADPIHGREWNTLTAKPGIDLQYACTFPLPTPRDCTLAANADVCDCGPGSDSPLCDKAQPGLQVRGKAYPTIRELRVAKALQDQGVVASLCARNVTDKTAADFGYRPAMRSILDRMGSVLKAACLPQPLHVDALGAAPCLVLVSFEPGAGTCDPTKGLKVPAADVLRRFDQERLDELRKSSPQATAQDLGPTCELTQIAPADYVDASCAGTNAPGWCYVTAKAAGLCPQAIVFSPLGRPASGAKVDLECIE